MVQYTRPKPNIKPTAWDRVGSGLGLAALTAMLLHLIISWPNLPERIPTHFGFSGQPDAWGGKGSLLAIPIIVTVMYILLGLLRKIPHYYNYAVTITEKNAQAQYSIGVSLITWLRTEICWIFLLILRASIRVGQGKTTGIGVVTLLFIVVIFATLFYFIYRMIKQK